ATIGGSEIERVVCLVVRLHPKGNPDEASRRVSGAGSWHSSDLGFDDSIRECRVAEPYDECGMRLIGGDGGRETKLETLLAVVRDGGRDRVVQLEPFRRLESVPCRLGGALRGYENARH